MKCENFRRRIYRSGVSGRKRLRPDPGASAELSGLCRRIGFVPANHVGCWTNGRPPSPRRISYPIAGANAGVVAFHLAAGLPGCAARYDGRSRSVGRGRRRTVGNGPVNHDRNTLATNDGRVVRINAPGHPVSDLQYLGQERRSVF